MSPAQPRSTAENLVYAAGIIEVSISGELDFTLQAPASGQKQFWILIRARFMATAFSTAHLDYFQELLAN
jgi:hypothetical protein